MLLNAYKLYAPDKDTAALSQALADSCGEAILDASQEPRHRR